MFSFYIFVTSKVHVPFMFYHKVQILFFCMYCFLYSYTCVFDFCKLFSMKDFAFDSLTLNPFCWFMPTVPICWDLLENWYCLKCLLSVYLVSLQPSSKPFKNMLNNIWPRTKTNTSNLNIDINVCGFCCHNFSGSFVSN